MLAEIGAHGIVAGSDNSLHSQPSRAIEHALRKSGQSVADLDLIEINEAFAAVVIQSMRDLGVSQDIVNVNGGAHRHRPPDRRLRRPDRAHLITELRRRGGGLGAAALCGGGGQGDALLFRVPAGRCLSGATRRPLAGRSARSGRPGGADHRRPRR